MTNLSTIAGGVLAIGSGVAQRVSDYPAGSIHQVGNFQTRVAAPYQAYLGMWGVYVPGNESLAFTCDMWTAPTFPAATTFNWNIITRDPDWGGIEGYLALMWGNYDDSAGGITPKQQKNITALSMAVDWTFSGDPATGLLCECWLTTSSTPTGPISGTALFEVGFSPKVSAHGALYAASLTPVGAGFTDANGAAWNVGQGDNGHCPYFYATRVGYVDHHGPFDFKGYLAYLKTAGKITGNEWFNGLAFGAECDTGAGSFTVNSFVPTYS